MNRKEFLVYFINLEFGLNASDSIFYKKMILMYFARNKLTRFFTSVIIIQYDVSIKDQKS